MKKLTAFITGVCGQDGSYLAKFLLSKGYEVYGGVRRSSHEYLHRLNALKITDRVKLVNFDLTDPINVYDIVNHMKFDEIYNLAAQSFVGSSWDLPHQTSTVNAMGPLYILDAIKRSSEKTKFYQASTSEMFGKIRELRQNEDTPFYPRSPYGVSKQFGHSITVNYRESFGIHASSGILFNHESPLRGTEFVTKKIAKQFVEIKNGKREAIFLGNLNAQRDWGYAPEYVEGMWCMLQENIPNDYVLATGSSVSVRDFASYVGCACGFDIIWEGNGLEEKGIDRSSGKVLVEISSQFYRPAEVDILLGDPTRAKMRLGWSAHTSAEELAGIMAKYELTGEM